MTRHLRIVARVETGNNSPKAQDVYNWIVKGSPESRKLWAMLGIRGYEIVGGIVVRKVGSGSCVGFVGPVPTPKKR